MNWFKTKEGLGRNWRKELRGVWKGSPPIQKPIKNLMYSTVLNVPNTPRSILLKELARQEPGLARMTKYSVKLVETSGVQSARLFCRVFVNNVCERENCQVCNGLGSEKPTKCKQSNVVYEAVCVTCEKQNEKEERSERSVYIGESSHCY